ncbi:Kiwa anti-phage protein KwaB-like domain-containing protein [Paenibacillus ottowii]|uniref:DUF4868 domain-containing protein n=1 Tax=Paenibacillus ottowii TaxID=2315729 RepID=A0ABY3B364_9BACL|nr:Kiwa anti-phage protein KwaB-like domain-containing protein [Paenibacillus ottowii]TQR98220.1 DUF4868 domain-containing protein [Paenibacillus ottowii]
MKQLSKEIILDFSEVTTSHSEGFSIDDLIYDTSFFIKTSKKFKKWSVKNIDMASNDQINIINNIKHIKEQYVEEYKSEDRDPEFIYKYNIAGLLLNTNRIQSFFTDKNLDSSDTTDEQVNTSVSSSDSNEIIAKKLSHEELVIENYEGTGYPPSDEVNLIIHRLKLKGSTLLVFCNQSRTSLAKTDLRTIINNKLTSVEKKGFYKINNDISFILTPENYYILSMDFFEKIFCFENYTKIKKQMAMESLSESNVIIGYKKLEVELNKGYMARSVAKISLNKNEIPTFIIKNKEAISKYCEGYKVGLNFNKHTNNFTVTDEKIAPLFITYLFSERVAENIIGELVYYKTFNKLNKN